MRSKLSISVLTAALIAALLIGCGKRPDTSPPEMLTKADNEYVICLTIDLSGSFLSQMAESGKAYDFATRLIDKYYRNKTTTTDKIILCQISGGTDKCLLWEGRIHDLRREFGTASQFRDFLLKHANPNASYVHDGLANVADYLDRKSTRLNSSH